MQNIALSLCVVAALANADSLTDMLRARLGQQVEVGQEALDCSNPAKLLCGTGAPVPSVTFSDTFGSVTSPAGAGTSCCKGNYLACQLQLKTPLCRDLATYVIPPSQGNAEDVCPPTTPECVCQQALAAERFLNIKLCPTPPDCCPTCECHGDPHCSSFDHKKASQIWAVCDDRDASCTHQNSTCAKTVYDGQTCQWINHGGGFGECVRASGTRDPVMVMYEKQYKALFTSDTAMQTFRLTLGLTTYGSISSIKIEDGATTNILTINSGGNCVGTPRFPIQNRIVTATGLPSGVTMQFQCMSTGTGRPWRWDVNYVKDPMFPVPGVVGPSQTDTFSGFCATGVIGEKNPSDSNGGCRIVDRQIANHFKCKASKNIVTCKNEFCNSQANNFVFTGLLGSVSKQCSAFVNDKNDELNFLYAACSLSTMHIGARVNPADCPNNKDCKQCVDEVTDFPEQITAILNARAVAPTNAPTVACPKNLLAIGLARKKLSNFNSGIQIEFNNAGTWESVFAVLDDEVKACGGCSNVLAVNGTVAANQVLLNPGTYRVRQCVGFNDDKDQAMCDGALGYNATVSYTNPFVGGAVSATYGDLFDAGDLVCSATRFPKCPINYQCCLWDKKSQRAAWNSCMDVFHGGAEKYPSCAN